MYALIFSAGGEHYAIEVSSVYAVAPAFDLEADASRALPFVGWRIFKDSRIPVFDLNYAIVGECSRRLFGTRHIIASVDVCGKKLSVAFMAESVLQVSEISDSHSNEIFSESIMGDSRVKLVNLSKLFEGALFDYE